MEKMFSKHNPAQKNKHTHVLDIQIYLRGESDLERERPGRRIGERLRLRCGDLLGGLRARLAGELSLREKNPQ